MLRATGIDIGATGTRWVSVGQFWGAAQKETSLPTGGSSIANLGADKLTFRRMSVPHVGRDIQAQVVREELSFSLPFSLEEAAWDWLEKDEMASVVVAFNEDIVAMRQAIGEHATIDAEPFSFLRALLEAKQTEALVFDFGATHTTVCGIKDRALEWIKVSLRGGQDLTKRLAQAHNLGEEEAEQHKRSLGCEDPICTSWLKEIIDSLALSSRPSFSSVFICGGGAALPGLSEKLQEYCGKEVKLFPLPESLSAYSDVPAYGAALAGKPRRPKVELCPPVQKSTDLPLIYIFWIALLIIMGTLDLELRHATLANLQQQQHTVISAAIQKEAPEMASLPVAEIPAEVEKRLTRAQQISLSSPENYTATLAAVDKAMSPLTNLEVRTIEFKPDNTGKNTLVLLTGLAESAQQVEEFRSACDKVLTQADLIDNRAGANSTTRFTIEGQLRQQ
ncbi:MAG: pilus assembly protein PilM [bacterium]|nr:pilus assembly protein PilM [bacterium]